jgi:hypothetical protein
MNRARAKNTSLINNFISILVLLFLCGIQQLEAASSISRYACDFVSVSPNMGPYYGGTNVTIDLECNSNNQTYILKTVSAHRILFGKYTVQIKSVEFNGYILTKVDGVEAPEEILWRYTATCDAPVMRDFTFTGNGSVVLVQVQPQSASIDLNIGGSIPYQYYNWSDIGIDVK